MRHQDALRVAQRSDEAFHVADQAVHLVVLLALHTACAVEHLDKGAALNAWLRGCSPLGSCSDRSRAGQRRRRGVWPQRCAAGGASCTCAASLMGLPGREQPCCVMPINQSFLPALWEAMDEQHQLPTRVRLPGLDSVQPAGRTRLRRQALCRGRPASSPARSAHYAVHCHLAMPHAVCVLKGECSIPAALEEAPRPA